MSSTPTFCNCVSNLLHSSFFCSMAISRDLSFESFLRPDDASDEACSFRSMRFDCRWTDSRFKPGGLSRPECQRQRHECHLKPSDRKSYNTRRSVQHTGVEKHKGAACVTMRSHVDTSLHPSTKRKSLSSPCTLTDLFLC